MRKSTKLLRNQARSIKEVSVKEMFLAVLDSVATTADYGFPSPVGHDHTASDITDFSEAVDDRISNLFLNGTGLTWEYNDLLNAFTPTVTLAPFNSDQLTEGSSHLYVTASQKSNWNTAYAWGNHAGLYSLLGHTHTTADITNLSSYTGFDSRYYTETEISSFFSGATAITGYNKSNWDTAYTWGNHASAGYLTSSLAASTYVSLAGTYVNPSWITSIAWSKITGTPTTLAGYGITDATSTSRTLTMTGTANQILVNGLTTAQTFDLSANRTWTFTLPQSIATNSTVQFGQLGVGTTAGKVIGPATIQTVIESATTTRGLGIISDANDITGVPIYVVKSRGTTVGGVTAVQAGDQILSLTGFGTDGTGISTNSSASIAFWVEGTVSTNIVPGYINFRTANSSGALTEAMRITSAQLVLIGKTSVGTGEQFQVQGTSKFYSNVTFDSTSTINNTMTFGNSGSIVMATGTGTETGINMSNRNIIGVNRFEFQDPGPNEGILWNGGNLWAIYESPNDLTTNTGGNLQFVRGTTRVGTFNTSNQLEIPVATGTAPFVITSTTLVSNLNADLLDGQHGSYYQAALSGTGLVKSTSGTITYITDNSSNWNTAYTWGNHAGLYSLLGHTHTTADITNLSSYTGFDARYYTETEISSFFSGSTSITGYNKSNWDSGYAWGNHAGLYYLINESTAVTDADSTGVGFKSTGSSFTGSPIAGTNGMNQGYLHTFKWFNANSYKLQFHYQVNQSLEIRIRRYNSDSTPVWQSWNRLWHDGNDGAGSGMDSDLLDGQQGTWYRDRTNHTGTQLAATISDFTTAVRTLISSTIAAITYTPGTGVLSMTAGYIIPTTTQESNWNTAYSWGNHASAGYLTTSIASATYLPLSGGTLTGSLYGTSASFSSTLLVNGATTLGVDGVTANHNIWTGTGILRIGRNNAQYFDIIQDATSNRFLTYATGKSTIFGTADANSLLLYTNNTLALTINSAQAATFSSTIKTTGLGVGNPNGMNYGLLSTYSSTYGTTSNLFSLGVFDGTYNPRVTVSMTTAVGVASTLKFESTYSSGWGFTNYSFANGILMVGSATVSGSSVLQVTGATTITGNTTITGVYTQNYAAGGNAWILQGAGTNHILQKFSNSGGNAYIGLASSTGGGLLGTTTTAYAFGVLTESTRPLILGTNNTARVTVDGTTGAVTLTSTITSTSLIKSGGTSSQFLKADGSVDTNTYLTTVAAAAAYVSLTGSYANPTWLVSIPWSKITSTPTTLAGYGITDAAPLIHTHVTAEITNLSSYTGFDARYYTETEISSFFSGSTTITGYNKSNWDTAYAWGNHASAGYLTTIPTSFGEVSDGHVADFSIDDSSWVNITGGTTPGQLRDFNPSGGGLVYQGTNTIVIAVEASISSIHKAGTGGGGFTANWLYAFAKNGNLITSSIQQFRTDGQVSSCTILCLVEVATDDVITVQSKAIIGYGDIEQEYFTMKAHRVS